MNLSVNKIETLIKHEDENDKLAPWETTSSQGECSIKNQQIADRQDVTRPFSLNKLYHDQPPNKLKNKSSSGEKSRIISGNSSSASSSTGSSLSNNNHINKNNNFSSGEEPVNNFFSSLFMYNNPSPTISSSSKMMILDENDASSDYYKTGYHRESLFMKKALSVTPPKTKKSKRRESYEFVYTSTSTPSIPNRKKRPISTSVLPNRSSRSSLLLQPHPLPQIEETSASSNKKRRGTEDNTKQRRYYSLQQLSQTDKTNLSTLITQHDQQIAAAALRQQAADASIAHWDPHIDAFDILRAKITGITRSMQEFQVQELFQDVMNSNSRRNSRVFPSSTTSSPLISVTKGIDYANRSRRRLSLATVSPTSLSTNHNNNTAAIHHHPRIKSSNLPTSSSPPSPSSIQFDLAKNEDNSILEEIDYSNTTPLAGFEEFDEEDDDEELDELHSMAAPKLTSLFLTTNNLISSRLEELSETASIASSFTVDNNNENSELDTTARLEWQKKFLSLVTACIHQSEQLESLSTDLLNTEHKVRELMSLNYSLHDQFHEREKQYEERIRECQEVAQQQFTLIESLEELTADITMKVESQSKEQHRQEALAALTNNSRDHQEDGDDDARCDRWNFQKSISDILHMNHKHDLIQKMRWDIGMFVGGGVGTGHVIHTFQNNHQLNGIDIMIAGTGTTTSVLHNNASRHSSSSSTSYNGSFRGYDEYSDHRMNSSQRYAEEFYSISPSIKHLGLYQHQYILHLTPQDRQTRFAMLPKSLWVPDDVADQCQFSTTHNHNSSMKKQPCTVQFSFFKRKHHCRKCGIIVCQQHGANRLPLFSFSDFKLSIVGKWSRVCDHCFQDLIMQPPR